MTEIVAMLLARIPIRTRAIVVAMLVVLLGGCNRAVTQSSGPSSLTVDGARDALIAMVAESNDSLLQSTLNSLRESKPRVRGEAICLGPWRCHLPQKTFVLTSDSPNVFVEYAGRFDQDRDGRWIATIDSITRT
ncbi:MAG: hypothetical protein MUF06_19710 [Pirellulaceae bacterium]|jgi:hypothetical protein|nr:hypothetical protein [Pirellulaceae bacterium]